MLENFTERLAQLPAPLVGPVAGRAAAKQWRGVLIDSARTCFSVDTICKTLHLLHRYGFNRLHWHLTDDAGWRFSVPEYPRLTEVGAFLPRNSFAHYHTLAPGMAQAGVEAAAGRWSNGFYTDAEISLVVETAHRLGIEIMPELDLPGHMLAAIASYPSLGRPAGLPLPEWGRPHLEPPARLPAANDLLWPTDEALQFLQVVLARVVELFPYSKRVHIGGDECALYQWETDPQMSEHLQRLQLPDEAALQRWFMERAILQLDAAGVAVGVWDEVSALDPDFPGLVFAWEAQAGMKRVRAATSRYVYADYRTLYFNQVDPDQPDQLGMVPPISVSDILCAAWPEYYASRCEGVQACAWAEFILDEAALFSHLFPRLLAVAERVWNPLLADRPATAAEAAELEQLIRTEAELLAGL
ncbi:MAG: family 20 glycosylhydrolase [Actinomycetaceae bacterium]|nr:family 20 glycosylhydrolase [Actinomycetaceae bacterium]